MPNTTSILETYSSALTELIELVKDLQPGQAFRFDRDTFPVYSKWTPYMASTFPVKVEAKLTGIRSISIDHDLIINNVITVIDLWERDERREGVMYAALQPQNYFSGAMLTQTEADKHKAVIKTLESERLITVKQIRDGRKTLTCIKAVNPDNYLGLVQSKPQLQPIPVFISNGVDNLPPARPVPAGRNDLVRAVKAMHTSNGRIDQKALLTFLMDVLGDESPERSPDPAPLITGLEAIEERYTNLSAGFIARHALEAYKAGQTLTIQKEFNE